MGPRGCAVRLCAVMIALPPLPQHSSGAPAPAKGGGGPYICRPRGGLSRTGRIVGSECIGLLLQALVYE